MVVGAAMDNRQIGSWPVGRWWWGLLAAPRIVRGRPSRLKGAFGVAARSLRDP
jgi:hypothetical protein